MSRRELPDAALRCPGPSRPVDLVDSYLTLLERSLTHRLHAPPDVAGLGDTLESRRLRQGLRRLGVLVIDTAADAGGARDDGRDWPIYAQTMIGSRRLSHLRRCVETILAEGIPGDLIETGVWRGGASILMRAVLHAHGVADRVVWLADSYVGLPAPEPKYEADADSLLHLEPELAIPRAEVEANFHRYGLLDQQVRFIEGWFADTLPTLREQRWALLRLDGDLFGSTTDALENLYPQLSLGGYVIVDDYGAGIGCREAVHQFRAANGITDEIHQIDWTGVYWRKNQL